MNGRANDRRLPPSLGGGRRPLGRTRRIAAAVVVVVVVASLGRRVGWLARFAPNGVVAAHHVVKDSCSLVALAWVVAGGADVVGSPSDTMGETIPGEERGSRDGGGWRPSSPSHVGVVLGGDCGLAAEFLVGVVEGKHEIGPSVLDRVATKVLNSSKSALCWRTMTAVRAALMLAGITRGWTGGTRSIQATVLGMSKYWAAGITEPTWPRMPHPRREG